MAKTFLQEYQGGFTQQSIRVMPSVPPRGRAMTQQQAARPGLASPKTFMQMATEAMAEVSSVTPQRAHDRLRQNANALLIDVRDLADRRSTGMAAGATPVSAGMLPIRADLELPELAGRAVAGSLTADHHNLRRGAVVCHQCEDTQGHGIRGCGFHRGKPSGLEGRQLTAPAIRRSVGAGI